MKIHGFRKTTLLDYPHRLAATIFVGSCNFRCPFCHNASLVLHPDSQPVFSEEEVLDTLRKRVSVLEGICITGGEPTLQEDLPEFIKKVKELGFAVKLDTNGSRPQMLHRLLQDHLLDYIAMDIKSSKKHYPRTAGLHTIDLKAVEESAALIRSCGLPYEFRTTAVNGLHSLSDFEEIGDWLHGSSAYYLQNFEDSGDLIGAGYSAFSKAEMEQFRTVLLPHFQQVQIRGAD